MKWQLCVLGPGAVLGVSCSWIGTSTEIVRHVNVSQTVIKNIKLQKCKPIITAVINNEFIVNINLMMIGIILLSCVFCNKKQASLNLSLERIECSVERRSRF